MCAHVLADLQVIPRRVGSSQRCCLIGRLPPSSHSAGDRERDLVASCSRVSCVCVSVCMYVCVSSLSVRSCASSSGGVECRPIDAGLNRQNLKLKMGSCPADGPSPRPHTHSANMHTHTHTISRACIIRKVRSEQQPRHLQGSLRARTPSARHLFLGQLMLSALMLSNNLCCATAHFGKGLGK